MIGRVLLAVDVGNSNLTVCGVRDAAPGALGAVRRATTDPGATADELELLLDGLLRLDGHRLDEVSAIALVSVVPSLTDALGRVADGRLIPLRIAEAGHLPLPVRVDRPLEVGADRLVNALATQRLHGAPAVVADVGTAITVDAVASDGAFLGGAIAAGPELGLRALAGSTAKLPRVSLAEPGRAIGRDTASALRAGAVLGSRDLVAGLIRRVVVELATLEGTPVEDVRTILTGGLAASEWAHGLDVDVVDPLLTLRGLAIFHAEVSGEAPAGLAV
jgi:type III pantothenate kinase